MADSVCYSVHHVRWHSSCRFFNPHWLVVAALEDLITVQFSSGADLVSFDGHTVVFGWLDQVSFGGAGNDTVVFLDGAAVIRFFRL